MGVAIDEQDTGGFFRQRRVFCGLVLLAPAINATTKVSYGFQWYMGCEFGRGLDMDDYYSTTGGRAMYA